MKSIYLEIRLDVCFLLSTEAWFVSRNGRSRTDPAYMRCLRFLPLPQRKI
jgi:hypothetical protein